MRNLPSLDLVILSYNRKELVQRAIRSALSVRATWLNLRVVVVDDGSTDGTMSALSHFGTSINVFRLDNNCGPGAASAFALQHVQSEFFARVDSDDFISSNFANCLLPPLLYNNQLKLASCDYLEVDEWESVVRIVDLSDPQSLENFGAGMIFRTTAVLEAGGYTEELRFREDLDLHLRLGLSNRERFHYPVPLYRRKVHEGNLSQDENHDREKGRIIEEFRNRQS